MIFVAVLALPWPHHAGADGGGASDVLAEYVGRPDPSSSWHEVARATVSGVDIAELRLVSQTWKGIAWKHQMYLMRPSDLPDDGSHAILIVSGGRWKEQLDQGLGSKLEIIKRTQSYIALVKKVQAPAIMLRQVPFQPLLGGLREDDAIAYTFEQYLDTGDSEWPLLLPMVKSVTYAMDATQEYSREHWPTPIEGFTVAGGSKRGWTTYLVAAVDDRVDALAPTVFDVVNMPPQMDYQKAVWGELSGEIAPYTERDIHQRLRSDEGESLRRIVDPYYYLDRLLQPKLVVLGTNDPYWPVDALSLYWDDLQGQKHVLYVPNKGHRVDDYERVFSSLAALHRNVANGGRLPQLDGRFEDDGDDVRLSIRSDIEPATVSAWVADATGRDFREAVWLQRYVAEKDGAWVFEIDMPETGYRALFGEAVYGNGDGTQYYLSTNVRVFGGARTGE